LSKNNLTRLEKKTREIREREKQARTRSLPAKRETGKATSKPEWDSAYHAAQVAVIETCKTRGGSTGGSHAAPNLKNANRIGVANANDHAGAANANQSEAANVNTNAIGLAAANRNTNATVFGAANRNSADEQKTTHHKDLQDNGKENGKGNGKSNGKDVSGKDNGKGNGEDNGKDNGSNLPLSWECAHGAGVVPINPKTYPMREPRRATPREVLLTFQIEWHGLAELARKVI
jgi:hypothetical protein